MADDGDENSRSSMDLNLYLGLPRSPLRRRSLADLGSDLALGSLPLSSAAPMSSAPHAPYSPTRASFTPDLLVDDPPDGMYSPSQTLPTVLENDELHMEAYDPMSPLAMADRASPPHMPYSQVASPFDDVGFDLGHFFSREDASSSHQDLLESPEFRLRRLIEVNHRLRHRRFRMSPSRDGEMANSGGSSPQVTAHLALDMYGKHDVPAKHAAAELSDEEKKEKIKSAANFECNICLDMAKEPVVTSCGHLFCWPCLFQWLHLHSDHRECPVCKGEVVESNVIPIYGRGSSESGDEKKLGKNEESCIKIPPRPHGNRLESFRQQLRPISRRLGEGIANSWRRLVDQRMRNRSNADPALAGLYDGGYRAPLTRMRARRIQREEGIPEIPTITRDIGLDRDNTSIPQASTSNLLYRDGNGIDLWRGFSLHNFSSSERLAAMAADVGTLVGRFASSSNQYVGSTSSINNPVPEPPVSRAPALASLSADQASASSTMAVIQGDVASAEASVEPNSAGSSRSYRRRGRSSTSGSLDVDEGGLHERKRRRLN